MLLFLNLLEFIPFDFRKDKLVLNKGLNFGYDLKSTCSYSSTGGILPAKQLTGEFCSTLAYLWKSKVSVKVNLRGR